MEDTLITLKELRDNSQNCMQNSPDFIIVISEDLNLTMDEL